MPELPEVETVVQRLRAQVRGRRVVAIEMASPRTVRGAPHLATVVTGARIVDIERVGKNIVVTTDAALVRVHLRMTGDLLVVAEGETPPPARLVILLDDGRRLVLEDARHLATVDLPPDLIAVRGALGADAWRALPDGPALRALLRSTRPIKTLLLDQTLLAGLGNIHADEALFRARIDPRRAGASLSDEDADRLRAGIHAALHAAIADLGAQSEIPWRHKNKKAPSPFLVYGRAGAPCAACGFPLSDVRLSGRTTVYCARCQT